MVRQPIAHLSDHSVRIVGVVLNVLPCNIGKILIKAMSFMIEDQAFLVLLLLLLLINSSSTSPSNSSSPILLASKLITLSLAGNK